MSKGCVSLADYATIRDYATLIIILMLLVIKRKNTFPSKKKKYPVIPWRRRRHYQPNLPIFSPRTAELKTDWLDWSAASKTNHPHPPPVIRGDRITMSES